MPAGAKPRRERASRKLEQEVEQQARYPGRGAEAAVRMVNKPGAEAGETAEARAAGRPRKASQATGLPLPIDGYQHLTVAQIRGKLAGLSAAQRQRLRAYEAAHKKRQGVLAALAD